MSAPYVKKKWQNLIHRKCVKCDSPLEEQKDRVVLLECSNRACDFFITRRKLFEILVDETHIMRRFLSYTEREQLEDAIEAMTLSGTGAPRDDFPPHPRVQVSI